MSPPVDQCPCISTCCDKPEPYNDHCCDDECGDACEENYKTTCAECGASCGCES